MEIPGIAVTFDGTTCPGGRAPANGGGVARLCLSGRWDFHFSGPSGSSPYQSVTFSDSHIIIEGTDCGGQGGAACGNASESSGE